MNESQTSPLNRWAAFPQFYLILALIVASIAALSDFGESYYTGKTLKVLQSLGGDNPGMQILQNHQWDSAECNAFIAFLILCFFWASRRKAQRN